jgi:hypothetical protein
VISDCRFQISDFFPQSASLPRLGRLALQGIAGRDCGLKFIWKFFGKKEQKALIYSVLMV